MPFFFLLIQTRPLIEFVGRVGEIPWLRRLLSAAMCGVLLIVISSTPPFPNGAEANILHSPILVRQSSFITRFALF